MLIGWHRSHSGGSAMESCIFSGGDGFHEEGGEEENRPPRPVQSSRVTCAEGARLGGRVGWEDAGTQ